METGFRLQSYESMQQRLICYIGSTILGFSALLLNLRVNSWRVYNARNLLLMGFSDSWNDAIGIASKLSYIGSYSSNVEEAGQDWKRFRPTEAPPQPVCSQSTSAGWSSQWLDIGPSTSDVKKSVAGQENGSGQDWKRFRPTEAPPQPVSSRLFPPQSTSAGWPSLRRDIGASTSDVKKSISLKDIDEWLRYL